MPNAWSKKDERQYRHVKQSELDRGRSEERAEEIAARTVNKWRSEEGRSAENKSRATGSPNTRLEDRTVEELRNRARELDISGRSGMTKGELVKAIRDRS